jgi:hypothetical protein
MASATTVYLTTEQRKALFSRARKRGTSLSDEVNEAIGIYKDFPLDSEKEILAFLATEAKASLDRSIARLDNAIAFSRRAARKIDKFDRHLRRLEETSRMSQ